MYDLTEKGKFNMAAFEPKVPVPQLKGEVAVNNLLMAIPVSSKSSYLMELV